MEYCRNRKEIPIPKRGKFHCAHKMDNGECCTYSAAFSFMKQRDGFMILDGRRPDGAEESGYSTNFCLEQSHPVEGVCVGADDCFSVSKHDDLKLEVVEFICTLAEVHCTIPLKDGLRHRFGKEKKRAFSSVLINNQLSAAKDDKDRLRMKELTEHGVWTTKNGGVWEMDISDFCELIGIRYQSSFIRQMMAV